VIPGNRRSADYVQIGTVEGGAENAGPENAGPENKGPNIRTRHLVPHFQVLYLQCTHSGTSLTPRLGSPINGSILC